MLEYLKQTLFVEHVDITFLCIAILLVTIVMLILALIRQHNKWKERVTDTEFEADNRIRAEQKRSRDELELLKKHIDADKTRLNTMAEKDLMITAIMVLNKLAYRLDALEKQGVSIEQGILEANHLLAAKQENSQIGMDENEYTYEYHGMFDSDEHIRCGSHADKNAVDLLYNSLHGDNTDTYTADNLVDAMSALDSNVYNLCKAIIYQNFMSMRKVDRLYDIIRKSED